MTPSARYAKIVAWSEEDQCFVGSAPGLIYGGCHGSDERQVFDELCRIVEDAVALYEADGKASAHGGSRLGEQARRCRVAMAHWVSRNRCQTLRV